jgi:hypothetical protein
MNPAFFTSLIVAVGLLGGCTSGPRQDEQVLRSYRIGMSHDEARAILSGTQPLASTSRPSAGWLAAGDVPYRAARAALACENSHTGAVVQTCEVYWIGRHTSTPLVAGGVWFDYLYFDGHEKLIGFDRRFVD